MPSTRRRTGPSIEDVARLAGVSAQTVSRVSTGAQGVRPATRERVVAAMGKLGYSPNRVARALRNGTFGTIGLLAYRFDRTGPALITHAVTQAAEAEGYAVTLVDVTSPAPTGWETSVSRLSSQAIDGLVVIRTEAMLPDALALPAGLPVVVSESRLDGRYPAVLSDQVGGTEAAVGHLLGLGHRTVHHLAGPEDSVPANLRLVTWRRCLEEAGLPVPAQWPGDWSAESGYRAGQRIALDRSITSVFCANDDMAFGLLRALHEAGRRVPADVSVVGFDGIELTEFSWPPLTTVRQDFQAAGHELVRLVLEQIQSRPSELNERVVVPAQLIVRRTTAPPT